MNQEDTVGGVMSKTVRTVDADQSLRQALKTMVKYDVGSIVVLKDGKPYGILTERDIVKHLGGTKNHSLEGTAGKLASRPLITTNPGLPLWEAFATMLRRKIRRLPVMNERKLVGIITERDLLKWVVGVTYAPNIPEEVKKLIAQNP